MAVGPSIHETFLLDPGGRQKVGEPLAIDSVTSVGLGQAGVREQV